MTAKEFLESYDYTDEDQGMGYILTISEICELMEEYAGTNTSIVLHPINMDNKENKLVTYCYQCGANVRNQKHCHRCGRKLIWNNG